MMIFINGTTKANIQYRDLCEEEKEVRIAYNNDLNWFEIDNIYNTMVEYPHWWVIGGAFGAKIQDYVILKTFFSKFNIKPTWINCNFTWGWFDDVTGHWTGAVGQVDIFNKV